MRLFSAFGVLGLLHVARGGKLDSFATDRARTIRDNITARDSRVSSISTSERDSAGSPVKLPSVFQSVRERAELHKRIVDQLDANQDGHVDASELTHSLGFMWGDGATVQRMLHTYGISDIEQAIRHHTSGDRE
ncbi:hypothetical protein FRC06_008200 [Ceratobasidium sp. 370]|nr:hypothetical protein FRC06_008200 [Ceratobasidium sp. 370]